MVQFAHMIAVSLHEPLKAFVDADHFAGPSARFQRNRADDAVDPGCRTSADENSEISLGRVTVVRHDDIKL